MADDRNASSATAELTIFAKSGGPLTKQIRLAPDGSVISDGSACIMAHGEAHRETVADVTRLGGLIEGLKSDEAIALGTLRADLPDRVEIATKNKVNGAPRPDLIA